MGGGVTRHPGRDASSSSRREGADVVARILVYGDELLQRRGAHGSGGVVHHPTKVLEVSIVEEEGLVRRDAAAERREAAPPDLRGDRTRDGRRR